MPTDLLKKREEIIAFHKTHESVPESPLSPAHPQMKAAMEKGAALHSERPIFFSCDDEAVVVGECVGKVLAGVKKFLAVVDATPESKEAWATRAIREPTVRQALTRCRLLDATSPPPTELRMHQQYWNAILYGLQEVGVLVVGADGAG